MLPTTLDYSFLVSVEEGHLNNTVKHGGGSIMFYCGDECARRAHVHAPSGAALLSSPPPTLFPRAAARGDSSPPILSLSSRDGCNSAHSPGTRQLLRVNSTGALNCGLPRKGNRSAAVASVPGAGRRSSRSAKLIPHLSGHTSQRADREPSWPVLLLCKKMASNDARLHQPPPQKDAADLNFDYMFKLLIIGNSSVGKTSFLFRYADDSFTPAFVSTVGIDFKVKTVFRNNKRIKLQIWVSG
ncbi:ras-related protein Rab-44-like [Fundulus heteroclitus]|uniref:ras-related protein Rab-44-like n=1 Tax=Fundulus heteroclitus TaxID=8078 RepID=UPI00165A70B2|nr:ras-related protein Rab-44-like [Fundulus heteroclitus]